MKLSVVTITLNEEQNISDCLKSVSWADELIVVDAHSTDRTVELARQYTDCVYVADWKGYAAAKAFALQQAKNEWVLWLDADERVTDELADEIREIMSNESPPYERYEVARRAFFLGKWIRHCGWYPGYVVRLFRKSSAQFSDNRVHEHIVGEGQAGRLRNDLLHFTDENLYHYFAKFNRYTSLAAGELDASRRKFSLYDTLIRPPYLFFKMYVIRLGLLDGRHGLILSLLSSAYVFTKYAKLWEISSGISETEELGA
jgi:glycosyltransferase involved in cell wall biosynthesis